MKCMEYSNTHHINIIPQQDFEELAQEVFNVIADNLTKSLGPLGSSATIFDGTIVEATKDGYHILDKYIFHNRYKKMIYNLIKTPCTRMNNTVGDGTTTAIALTNSMYQLYKKHEDEYKKFYRLPRQFTRAWNNVVTRIVEKVKVMATSIDPEDYDTIYHLAYISANGNEEIAEAFAKTYKEAKSPAIKMKDSPTNKSYIEAVDGFEFPTNTIDPVYVRNQDMTATEKNVRTMIFDHKIESDEFTSVIIPINEVMRAMGTKLIIIAPEYDNYMLDTTVKGYVNLEYQKNRALNLVLTQYSAGKLKPFQREDLAAVLKSVVVNQNLSTLLAEEITNKNADIVIEKMHNQDDQFHRVIGEAESVLLSMGNGCIFKISEDIKEDENYQSILNFAKKELQDILDHVNYEAKSYSAKVYDARSRIMQLEMKNYIYYIGADSELQRQIIKDAVDDVIKCLRSAIKNGVVPGCQISIVRAAGMVKDDNNTDMIKNIATIDLDANELECEICDLIIAACKDTYIRVLQGPNETGLDTIIDKDERIPIEQRRISKALEVVNESLTKYKVFDLETLDFNSSIITSAETDTMVLTAASELIKILISGNQCVFLDSEVNSSHQDDVTVYA